MNSQCGTDIMTLFEGLNLDGGDTRCVILTGAGERAFCAGADLKERKGMTDEAWTSQHLIYERMVRAILACPIPVIAAVHGAALAGGCELALACDFIYAAEQARFALTEVTLGIMPGAGGTQTLPRAIGERRAKEFLFTGKPFTAAQAHAWGMVSKVLPAAQLIAEALATAETIARNAPISVRTQTCHRPRREHVALGRSRARDEAYYRMVPTEDRREGILAFNEKRVANFKGK